MSYEPTSVETEDGKVTQIFFECERKELRNVLDEIIEVVRGIDDVNNASIIRRKQRNPVIKTDRNDRIYFRWDEGKVRVNLGLSHDPVPEVISAYFIDDNGDESEDPFPWDREEMAEEARNIMDERSGSDEGATDPSMSPGSVEDRKRRAREEGSRRDERQKDPVGGQERRGKNEFEIINGKTAFKPAFTKDEANYKRPGEGANKHLDCQDCVNYIEGGGCQIVQGEVHPEAYCEDLYSDVAIFGRVLDSEFEVNLALWGEMFEERFGTVSFEAMADRIKEAIRRKL